MDFLMKEIPLPAIEYVRKMVLPHVGRDENGYVFPDFFEDFCKLSRMHSWYKHLREQIGTFYPVLIYIDKQKRHDDFAVGWHWIFFQDHLFLDAEVPRFEESENPISILFDRGIMLTDAFSNFDASEDADEDSQMMRRMAAEQVRRVQNRIVRILLQIDDNPPENQVVYHDSSWDKETTKTIEINGKTYQLDYQ